ncbi:hypothetical protein MS3_00005487 [Schistosoma haematobium]|uniref:Uncharacterized protein n=2 Tax=Schistosoma haematobium TaxID=6185 RepID=A0A6A5D8E0_SCHHA|nr:hypothetical protein MS3_00005487 [Schistosoma haematobium]KAH9587923.1 hypothetical protein MS3_00005487 [Schistosoma haematobium]
MHSHILMSSASNGANDCEYLIDYPCVLNSLSMLGEVKHSTPDFRTQRRKSTRKSLLICTPCLTEQNLDEHTLTSDVKSDNEINDDELTDELAKRYQGESRKWDQLVEEYETRLIPADNRIDMPSEEWIKTDRVTRKYEDIIFPQKYFDSYDSLDSLADSLLDTHNDIFFELEKLPHLIERQDMFLKSFRKKMRLKQSVSQDSYFGSASPLCVISNYLGDEV